MMSKQRCWWVKDADELYQRYHDQEWGLATHDDQYLFEILILESFHVGLSWYIVLQKRDNFKRAFDNFDIDKIIAYDNDKIESLMKDKGIIRHRKKILATISNAIAFKKIQETFGSFDDYLYRFTDGRTIIKRDSHDTKDDLSDRITIDLKKRGFSFLGSTTIYAYLQAVGVIDGHDSCCFRVNDDR